MTTPWEPRGLRTGHGFGQMVAAQCIIFRTGHQVCRGRGPRAIIRVRQSPEVYFLLTYLNLVQILVSVVLIVVVLLQAKGSGFSGSFVSESSAYRSRRGVERTLFNFTIGLAVLFILISIVTVKFFS